MEIIETYWNVNEPKEVLSQFSDFEIIETYWNVNAMSALLLIYRGSGNNRNILECKLMMVLMFIFTFITEIIETYWNVNLSDSRGFLLFSYEIIETYWNVNTN